MSRYPCNVRAVFHSLNHLPQLQPTYDRSLPYHSKPIMPPPSSRLDSIKLRAAKPPQSPEQTNAIGIPMRRQEIYICNPSPPLFNMSASQSHQPRHALLPEESALLSSSRPSLSSRVIRAAAAKKIVSPTASSPPTQLHEASLLAQR